MFRRSRHFLLLLALCLFFTGFTIVQAQEASPEADTPVIEPVACEEPGSLTSVGAGHRQRDR
jgi:hypothetical protein